VPGPHAQRSLQMCILQTTMQQPKRLHPLLGSHLCYKGTLHCPTMRESQGRPFYHPLHELPRMNQVPNWRGLRFLGLSDCRYLRCIMRERQTLVDTEGSPDSGAVQCWCRPAPARPRSVAGDKEWQNQGMQILVPKQQRSELQGLFLWRQFGVIWNTSRIGYS
jgi:hypothetical protein